MDDANTITLLAVWFAAFGLVAFVFVEIAKRFTEATAGRIIAGTALTILITGSVIAPMEYRPTKDLICSSEIVMVALSVYCVACFTPAMMRWKSYMQAIVNRAERDA